jgi:glycerophosphoryl diester phosphodiesterase
LAKGNRGEFRRCQPAPLPVVTMNRSQLKFGIAVFLGSFMLPVMVAAASDFLVIAHRGASGYLPEHTLEAKAMAHAMGVGAIEQDVVMTRDDHLIVLHDIHLDTVTDVAERFPGRAREDGRYYAIDFDLDEIRQLVVSERFDRVSGQAVYPERFPVRRSHFQVPTLESEIELIQGMNRSTGREVAIYVEFKAPAWHRRAGKDPGQALLAILNRYGYSERGDPCFVQCFDPDALARLRNELQTDLKLIQLIGENDWGESSADYDQMRTAAGLREIAAYADGIGPHYSQLVEKDPDGTYTRKMAQWVDYARDSGLLVHPFTFRADEVPEDTFPSFEAMVRFFAEEAKVDGLFTDHPDRVIRALQQSHP